MTRQSRVGSELTVNKMPNHSFQLGQNRAGSFLNPKTPVCGFAG